MLDAWVTYAHEFTLARTPAAFRAVAGVHGEFDAAYLYDPSSYDHATVDTYEGLIYQRESYAALSFGPLEVASGRMVVPMGQGEILGLVDVLDARDQREPGLTEADRVHLPALTTRITAGVRSHRMDAIVVHEAFFGLVPPPLGDFSPLRKLLVDAPVGGSQLASYEWVYQQNPAGLDVGGWQYLGHYGFTGKDFDVDFYAGSVLDRLGVTVPPPPQAYQSHDLTLQVYHPRYVTTAHTGAWTVGPVVIRWEAGVDFDRPETVRVKSLGPLAFEVDRRTQLNALVGATYFAPFDANVGLEIAESHVFDDPGTTGTGRELLWPIEQPSAALRWTQNLLSQRLAVEIIGVAVGVSPFNGALVRGEVAYALNDAIHLAVGYVHYAPTSQFGPFYGFEKNDRAYANFKWDFSVF
jgi:hypothetical protein